MSAGRTSDVGGMSGRGGGIWAVVLAAGLSRRMQRPGLPSRLKPLLPMPDGRPMIRWVVDSALAAQASGVIVVVPESRAGEEIVQALADSPAECVENPHFEVGQSASLYVGVRALQERQAAAGVFLLADEPDLSTSAVDAVIACFLHRKALVVQANYLDGPGHPVLFAASLFEELKAVQGDEGGRSVVRAHAEHRVFAAVDARAPLDIDTPEAYDAIWAGRD